MIADKARSSEWKNRTWIARCWPTSACPSCSLISHAISQSKSACCFTEFLFGESQCTQLKFSAKKATELRFCIHVWENCFGQECSWAWTFKGEYPVVTLLTLKHTDLKTKSTHFYRTPPLALQSNPVCSMKSWFLLVPCFMEGRHKNWGLGMEITHRDTNHILGCSKACSHWNGALRVPSDAADHLLGID